MGSILETRDKRLKEKNMSKLNKLLVISAFALTMFHGANAGLPKDAILLGICNQDVPICLGLDIFKNESTNKFDTLALYFEDKNKETEFFEFIMAQKDTDEEKQKVVGRLCQNAAGFLYMERLLDKHEVSTLRLDIARDLAERAPLTPDNLQMLLLRVNPLGINKVTVHYLEKDDEDMKFSKNPITVVDHISIANHHRTPPTGDPATDDE